MRYGYGTIYGMKKTTVYLPDDLKNSLEVVAKNQDRSEAELIREAISVLLEGATAPKPKLPLFSSGDPTLADRVDEELKGFGLN